MRLEEREERHKQLELRVAHGRDEGYEEGLCQLGVPIEGLGDRAVAAGGEGVDGHGGMVVGGHIHEGAEEERMGEDAHRRNEGRRVGELRILMGLTRQLAFHVGRGHRLRIGGGQRLRASAPFRTCAAHGARATACRRRLWWSHDGRRAVGDDGRCGGPCSGPTAVSGMLLHGQVRWCVSAAVGSPEYGEEPLEGRLTHGGHRVGQARREGADDGGAHAARCAGQHTVQRPAARRTRARPAARRTRAAHGARFVLRGALGAAGGELGHGRGQRGEVHVREGRQASLEALALPVEGAHTREGREVGEPGAQPAAAEPVHGTRRTRRLLHHHRRGGGALGGHVDGPQAAARRGVGGGLAHGEEGIGHKPRKERRQRGRRGGPQQRRRARGGGADGEQ